VRAAVGTVAGHDVLHVQCHLAFDAITLARHGARVTGVAVHLVEGDATDLPTDLSGRFDLAYATIGILCWIDDVGAWMRSVAGTLRPGGRLLLIDGHPLGRMVDQVEPLVLGFPYENDGPHVYESTGSYAAATPTATTNVLYAHSLGEVVTAAAPAASRRRVPRPAAVHVDRRAATGTIV
jgi:SAM-dependent methyltransferase